MFHVEQKKERTEKMKKYIKVQMPKNKKHICPICGYTNNFLYGDTCKHVDRLTVKSVIFYNTKERAEK